MTTRKATLEQRGGASSASDGSPRVLDGEQLESLRELAAATGDPAFLRGLVDRYLDGAARRLAELQAAARRGDAAALEEAAHGLRGSSASMSAAALASVCAEIEATAGRGEAVDRALVQRVATELQRAAAALRACA